MANDAIAPHASDPVSPLGCLQAFLTAFQGNAERLWTLTEKIIGEPFTF